MHTIVARLPQYPTIRGGESDLTAPTFPYAQAWQCAGLWYTHVWGAQHQEMWVEICALVRAEQRELLLFLANSHTGHSPVEHAVPASVSRDFVLLAKVTPHTTQATHEPKCTSPASGPKIQMAIPRLEPPTTPWRQQFLRPPQAPTIADCDLRAILFVLDHGSGITGGCRCGDGFDTAHLIMPHFNLVVPLFLFYRKTTGLRLRMSVAQKQSTSAFGSDPGPTLLFGVFD